MKFRESSVEKRDEPSLAAEGYGAEAARVLEAAWDAMHAAQWRLEKRSAAGDAYSAKLQGASNAIFKMKTVIDKPPEALLSLLFDNPEEYSRWNPVLEKSVLLERVGARAHVSYQVTAERLGGLVARRDFVLLSAWAARGGALVLASASVEHRLAPPTPARCVRGENRPGCYIIRPAPDDPGKSLVEWFLDTNLKGWLPQKILDAAFSSIMLDNLKNLKAFISK